MRSDKQLLEILFLYWERCQVTDTENKYNGLCGAIKSLTIIWESITEKEAIRLKQIIRQHLKKNGEHFPYIFTPKRHHIRLKFLKTLINKYK